MNDSLQDLRRLDTQLSRLFARSGAHHVSAYRPLVYVGLESRRAGEAYEWRGHQRGAETDGAGALFQYTLEGWGEFADDGARSARVGAGMAFTAILPSPHTYRLPAASPGWRFFWLIIHHPYIVRRLAAGSARRGGVWTVPAGGALATHAAALWAAVCRGTPEDEWAQEAMLFSFLLAHERHGRALAHPVGPRERLLAEAHQLVAAATDGTPPRVEDLAGRHGMSRSHFSHHFRAVTGRTPAAVLLAARLAVAARQLETGGDKLNVIARAAGFADATGFCRVFRQHYHVSPGRFRQQAQGH